VVRVLPVAVGLSKERSLRHGQNVGGGPAQLACVVGRWRQTTGLIGPRSMLRLLVLARKAAAADRRLLGLTASVVVRVDRIVVVLGQLAAVVSQKLRVGEMLIEFVGD